MYQDLGNKQFDLNKLQQTPLVDPGRAISDGIHCATVKPTDNLHDQVITVRDKAYDIFQIVTAIQDKLFDTSKGNVEAPKTSCGEHVQGVVEDTNDILGDALGKLTQIISKL
jgi:hypothetical protein